MQLRGLFHSYPEMEVAVEDGQFSYFPTKIHRGPTAFGILHPFFFFSKEGMWDQPGWITGVWDVDTIWLPFYILRRVWRPLG